MTSPASRGALPAAPQAHDWRDNSSVGDGWQVKRDAACQDGDGNAARGHKRRRVAHAQRALDQLLDWSGEKEHVNQESQADKGGNHAAKVDRGPRKQPVQKDHDANSGAKVDKAGNLQALA